MGFGLGLGLGMLAMQGAAGVTDPYTLATWGAYFDESTITVSSGSNINAWNDRTAGAHNWSVSNGTPQQNTLNGFNVATVGGADAFVQAAASSVFFTNGASGTGYMVIVARMSAIAAAGANAGLNPGLVGFGSNYGGVTCDSTNGFGSYVYDTTTYESAYAGAGSTTNTKVIEFWWDSGHVYCRVNGGTTFSHAATNGPGSLATAMSLGKNDGSGVFVSASFHMVGFLPAVPGNANAIVSALMTKYSAA